MLVSQLRTSTNQSINSLVCSNHAQSQNVLPMFNFKFFHSFLNCVASLKNWNELFVQPSVCPSVCLSSKLIDFYSIQHQPLLWLLTEPKMEKEKEEALQCSKANENGNNSDAWKKEIYCYAQMYVPITRQYLSPFSCRNFEHSTQGQFGKGCF